MSTPCWFSIFEMIFIFFPFSPRTSRMVRIASASRMKEAKIISTPLKGGKVIFNEETKPVPLQKVNRWYLSPKQQANQLRSLEDSLLCDCQVSHHSRLYKRQRHHLWMFLGFLIYKSLKQTSNFLDYKRVQPIINKNTRARLDDFNNILVVHKEANTSRRLFKCWISCKPYRSILFECNLRRASLQIFCRYSRKNG